MNHITHSVAAHSAIALPEVQAVNESIRDDARLHVDQLTKPLGALGQLETLAIQLCAVQGSLKPSLHKPTALVFAADHGAAQHGVSAYPSAVTAQMVGNFLAGGAAISVLARHHEITLKIVNAGVATAFKKHPQLINCPIRAGSRDYLVEPALTTAELALAITRAEHIVTDVVLSGSNTILLGEMGIGNTASAALLMHGLTGIALADCVGRGTGLDDAGLAHKLKILTKARARAADAHTPLALLCEFGGYEIAMLCGAILAAAAHRSIVVIDGFTVTVAAALAIALQPHVKEYCVFSHRSAEYAHGALLNYLSVEPVLSLGMRLGEGSGAGLALPLLRAALGLFNEMATFGSAGVSQRTES